MRPVQGTAIVEDQQVTDPPLMPVDEFRPDGRAQELLQQGMAVFWGHTLDILALGRMVRATADVDLLDIARAQRPAQGLCLGFGMNALEPYDLLRVFDLDRVHAYEWIGEQVEEAARTLHELRTDDPLLPGRIRLHHESLSNLRALADASIRIVYTANVFNAEIPMTSETFHGAVRDMLRVLSAGGVVISRGSIGTLEAHLAPHGRMLLQTGLVSVFQKQESAGATCEPLHPAFTPLP